ncbi:hypothetical protein, partial [Pseudactinotalea sp.]|uniref:hypothetical protein n=1 Tax=Pseudactinotalea sp. TaxID=1926260 RepID=UPI003B3A7B1C
ALAQTAAWYPVLKQRRRALRITSGNPQETCFPVAFELATTRGAPGQDAAGVADTALADRAAEHPDPPLDHLLDDPSLATHLEQAWDRTGADTADWADHEAAATAALLTTFRALGTEHAAAAWADWLALPRPAALAESLRFGDGDTALRRAVEQAIPGAVTTPLLLTTLGLAEGATLARPCLRGTQPDALLERSIERRLRSAVRRSSETSPEQLVEAEIARASEPAGLLAASLAAAFLLGAVLAPALRPLAPTEEIADPAPVLAEIRTRFAREAYVLRARRYVAGGVALAAPDAGLTEVMRDLLELYRPFLRRLWARLHGFELAGTGTLEVAEVRDLLTGVARSVSLDLRTRIRRTLERQVAA